MFAARMQHNQNHEFESSKPICDVSLTSPTHLRTPQRVVNECVQQDGWYYYWLNISKTPRRLGGGGTNSGGGSGSCLSSATGDDGIDGGAGLSKLLRRGRGMNPVILEAIPLQAILLAQDRACAKDRSIVSDDFELKSPVCKPVALDRKDTCDGRKP